MGMAKRMSSRMKTLTEKGETYHYDMFIKQLKQIELGIYKHLSVIENVIKTDSSDPVYVRSQLKFVDDSQSQFSLILEKAEMIFSSKDILSEFREWFNKLDHEVCFVKSSAINWLRKVEDYFKSSRASSRSFKCPSSHSSRGSSRSSRSSKSKMVEEETVLAELKVRREFAEKKGSVEQMNYLDEEIAVRVAKIGVLKSHLETPEKLAMVGDTVSLEVSNSLFLPVTSSSKRVISTTTPPIGVPRNTTKNTPITSSLSDIKPAAMSTVVDIERNTDTDKLSIDRLCDLFQLHSAPEIDLEVFKGDPLEFSYFMTSFEEVVEKKVKDSSGRLTRLIKYTSGDAKELVKGCIYDKKEGYNRAKKLLTNRYGDPHRILSTYSKELKEWKIIKYGDSLSLRTFYTFLLKCSCIVEVNYSSALDSIDNLCTILSKLPGSTREKWNTKAFRLRTVQYREPEMRDMINFMDEQLTLWSDPLFSKEALEQRKSLGDKKEGFSSSSQRSFKNYGVGSVYCRLCNSNHDVEYCHLFKDKAMKDKISLLMKFRLCFGCFSKGHIRSQCKKVRVCKICKKDHPTSLHGYVPKAKIIPGTDCRSTSNTVPQSSLVPQQSNSESIPITSALVSNESSISMCIVPVILAHPNSSTEIKTFALLDACSQGTFINETLLESFKIDYVNTNITVKTLTGCSSANAKKVSGMLVKGLHNDHWLKLSTIFSRENLDIDGNEVPSVENLKNWPYLHKIVDVVSKAVNSNVGILIGSNCPRLIEPLQVIPSENNGPYAFKTRLGWCVVGPMTKVSSALRCHRISVKDNGVEKMLKRLYEIDKVPSVPIKGDEISQDDLKFLNIMKEHVRKSDGHYEVPLPFRHDKPVIPNNLHMAEKRLLSIKKRFERDFKFKNDYVFFVNKLFEKGYARKVTKIYPHDQQWFIPHHGVYHPRKKKIRVVFDCSSSSGNVCLNDLLLQGPDLTNDLLGVLIRFREEIVAFMADIEAMFYQVNVPENQRNFLQFLWWEDGDTSRRYQIYEMCVHVFGSTSSPSCSNFALKAAAADGRSKYGDEASNVLERSFYVDDLLKSTSSLSEASNLIDRVVPMCQEGGFRLTKFVSNVPEALQNLKSDDRKDSSSIDAKTSLLQSETALGLPWNLTDDSINLCNNSLRDSKITRRGILSTVSSIYDPLGVASPFVLEGKLILQRLCQLQLGWDDPLPKNLQQQWLDWKYILPIIETMTVPRCYKPSLFNDVKEISLHHFSDASDTAYGCCSYVRLVDLNGAIHCTLVVGKSRVAPIKPVSTPRLELIAAVLNVSVANIVRRELDYKIDFELFYTDSTIVLGYIKNQSKRFKRFVANRIRAITKSSEGDQWFHVESKQNSADCATRGLRPDSPQDRIDLWLNGPKFLWGQFDHAKSNETYQVCDSDPECASIKVNATVLPVGIDILSHLEERVSDFDKAVRILAYVKMFVRKLKRNKTDGFELNVDDISSSFTSLKVLLQNKYYKSEIISLKQKGFNIKNCLASLDPFLDESGLIRVGGRLGRSLLDHSVKHPVILPKQSSIVKALIRRFHHKVKHAGRGITMNAIRDSGVWITNMNSLCKDVIRKCVGCKRLRGSFGKQVMSDLPVDRTLTASPFTYVGVDLFGPFVVKERRSELKRYGVMFTCLSCRGVHLECVNSLTTDSFILALRRFIARRGNVRVIRSDNGTNFVGAKRELQSEFKKMDHTKISDFLKGKGTDWVEWINNPPYASHFGGVWERQIRTAREILNGILFDHGTSLNDESLKTMFCEVECVINSRPLTVECLNDPLSPKPLSPNNLLTTKNDVILPPPGNFEAADIYSRKYWRRVQHLTNEFWQRWKKEYLQALQPRPKWTKRTRNFQVDDVVLMKDEDSSRRNEWPMGIITNVKTDEKDTVRSVTLRTTKNEKVVRPINKLVMLLESPMMKPKTQDKAIS